MRFPRSSPGPLKAVPNQYYYARVFRQVPDRKKGHADMITLVPNSIFVCEALTSHGPKIFARCRTQPHDVVFFLQISGHHLMPAGYEPLKSPLLLLAAQADEAADLE